MCDFATIEYDAAEYAAETCRHHKDFAKISELAAEAEVILASLPIPRQNIKCEQLHSTIRAIRNLVG